MVAGKKVPNDLQLLEVPDIAAILLNFTEKSFVKPGSPGINKKLDLHPFPAFPCQRIPEFLADGVVVEPVSLKINVLLCLVDVVQHRIVVPQWVIKKPVVVCAVSCIHFLVKQRH